MNIRKSRLYKFGYKLWMGYFIFTLNLIVNITSCKLNYPDFCGVYEYNRLWRVGIPPWNGQAWKRVHQPEDPDWRYNLPWDQQLYDKGNIIETKEGLQIWRRNGKDGMLYSNFTFKYGVVKGTFKLPQTPGLWSAFWLYGENGMPEHDIFEHCGGDDMVSVTYHHGYDDEHKKQSRMNKRAKIKPGEWNDFMIDITPYWSKFYVNGKLVRKVKEKNGDEHHILMDCKIGDYCDYQGEPEGYLLVKGLTVVKYK